MPEVPNYPPDDIPDNPYGSAEGGLEPADGYDETSGAADELSPEDAADMLPDGDYVSDDTADDVDTGIPAHDREGAADTSEMGAVDPLEQLRNIEPYYHGDMPTKKDPITVTRIEDIGLPIQALANRIIHDSVEGALMIAL